MYVFMHINKYTLVLFYYAYMFIASILHYQINRKMYCNEVFNILNRFMACSRERVF